MKRKLSPPPYEAGECSSSGSRVPGHPHSTPSSCERAKTKLTTHVMQDSTVLYFSRQILLILLYYSRLLYNTASCIYTPTVCPATLHTMRPIRQPRPIHTYSPSPISRHGQDAAAAAPSISRGHEWRTIKWLVHKFRLHGRRRKGMAESFSREKLRHAPQKEGG